ncbi:FG-GAP repeat domain-containing protein [Lentiprolixibacter aurantiacus]|uniref:VCBS repeat-containing protein n=1 Tax=Lentiprolixibacter aurantiacus TaxID=2993939 RepID=A0AAE3SMN1_9FLAO|nr:VCBS repeat-containing protein [Lentiprolixibacter aurantiacus]MCX2718471.1 VCBS repeat-containing protein [Lentiprolixibacter aurantiacus]
MTRLSFLFTVVSFLTLLSCKDQGGRAVPAVNNTQIQNLWVDETATYLPITAEWTNRVEVADINGDRRIDLLFANGGNYSEPGDPETSRIFINQGPGKRFKEITADVFGENKYLSRVIKVSDVNQDGVPDIVLGATYQTQSQLYLGIGSGKFKNVTANHFPRVKASVGDIELGDVDGDGDLDMILSDWGPGSNMDNSGGRTMLWLNDGKGVFTNVTEAQMPNLLIQFSWDLEFFDFDNDFDLDIAVSCKRCATSRLFVNDGKGNFENQRLLPAYTNNYDFEVMDVNNDGFLDMVTINDGEIVKGERFSRREHVFLNQEGKRFIDATHALWPDSENIGEDDNNSVFLDYDSDGDPDFLISSLTGEDRLMENTGGGHFKLLQPVLKGAPTPLTLSMVLGDIDNDNRLDIIMGQGEGSEGIEERIFIGKNIPPDTAAPVISHYRISENQEEGTLIVEARIHDNKSPSMPHDWDSVSLSIGEAGNPIPMNWYGEYLWRASFPAPADGDILKICAVDYSKNEKCITTTLQSGPAKE